MGSVRGRLWECVKNTGCSNRDLSRRPKESYPLASARKRALTALKIINRLCLLIRISGLCFSACKTSGISW